MDRNPLARQSNSAQERAAGPTGGSTAGGGSVWVEVRFVGAPPVRQIERASGVADVEIDAQILRCRVAGSFQPFLEALRGHEVIALRSTPSAQ